jgi:hypothetical protein
VRNGVVDLQLTRTSVFWLVFGNLVVAGVTWIGLVFSVAAGSAGAEQLRKQLLFDPEPIELGLTILGPVGAVFFLLVLVTNGYAELIPGLLCAVLGAASFFRTGVRRERFGGVEVAFSFGALIVGSTFIYGANYLISKVGQSLESIGIEYGPLVRGGVWLAAAGIFVLMFKLWERNLTRRHLEHTTRMQNEATYRKLFEEKCRLERRLKDIHSRQEYYENELQISRSRGTE